MNAVRIILLVAFILICLLLVLLVLVQDDGQSGMGGLLGGRGTAAFGSHSANVLTKATFVLVVLFFSLALFLALLNKKSGVQKTLAPNAEIEMNKATGSENKTENTEWWSNGENANENSKMNIESQNENTNTTESSTTTSSTTE